MLFSIFKKKKQAVVINRVWSTETAKWNACKEKLADHPDIIFVAWFYQAHRALVSFLPTKAATQVRMAEKLSSFDINPGQIIFIEHHPMQSRELELMEKLGIQKALVFCSLDEAFFQSFGGERISHLMGMMGNAANECIEHKLIDNSIVNAQRKIEKKVTVEQFASSQEEWLRRNVGSAKL